MTRAQILLTAATVVVLVLGVAMAVYLVRGHRQHARFTTELRRHSGPDVVLSGVQMMQDDAAAQVAAIERIYDIHNEAWCKGDGDVYASVFTEDADFISFDGTHTTGRDAIARSHQELFDRFLSGTCLEGRITRVKFLRPDAAVVHVVSGTRFGDSDVVRRPSIQTYVAVEQDGEWRFSSFHNGRIDRIEDRPFLRLAWLGLETFVFRR
jgi:uncharacterized protein (TIGR02246 family)